MGTTGACTRWVMSLPAAWQGRAGSRLSPRQLALGRRPSLALTPKKGPPPSLLPCAISPPLTTPDRGPEGGQVHPLPWRWEMLSPCWGAKQLSLPVQIQSGIGRLILREEMKARSNSYADPWTPPRSSASSREALHTAGYEGSLNGCKDSPVYLSVPPCMDSVPVGSSLGWRGKDKGMGWVVGEGLDAST